MGGVSCSINGSSSYADFAEMLKSTKLHLKNKKRMKMRNGEQLNLHASQTAEATLILIRDGCLWEVSGGVSIPKR